MRLNRGGMAPLSPGYCPELDANPELELQDATYYQSLIGILRWMVEMGRIDITWKVSMMSSFVAMTCEGHLQQLLHLFAYLKYHHNARIAFDPSYPAIDSEQWTRREWRSLYGEELKEEILPNAPEPPEMEFILRTYVDADHAGDRLTRRPRSGMLVLINSAPIYWLSKKKMSVETSSLGSKLVAMKICCEYLRGLRYKLRMMRTPVSNSVFIYGYNQPVLWKKRYRAQTWRRREIQ